MRQDSNSDAGLRSTDAATPRPECAVPQAGHISSLSFLNGLHPGSADKVARPLREVIRAVPIGSFAAVMGIAGLSLAWRYAGSVFGAPALIGEAIGMLATAIFIALAGGFLAKSLMYPSAAAAEFNDPVAVNFFGTFNIALLLVSAVLRPYTEGVASALWLTGTVLTFSFAVATILRLLKGNLPTSLALPAWLISGVASLDIPVTAAGFSSPWAVQVNLMALAVGTGFGLVFFILIFHHLIHGDALPRAMTPTLMILIAPFEVGFLAYTNFYGRIDQFASLLFYFGLFLFFVLTFKVFRRDIPFSVTWWAIGFPIAALSNAALMYAAAHPSWPMIGLAWGLLFLLTCLLLALGVRTMIGLIRWFP